MAVFLATDEYDHSKDKNTISVTALLKPIRQTILGNRIPPSKDLVDVSSLIASRLGTCIHNGLESAWLNNYKKAMEDLGYPQKIIDKVKINPDPTTVTEDDFPIYLEKRSSKEITISSVPITVTGKFDMVVEGRVEDLKTTSTYTYSHKTNDDKYILQGSIYRWLNQDIINNAHMAIQFVFLDWSAGQLKIQKTYPPTKVLEHILPLLSLAETETYIKDKLSDLLKYQKAKQEDIPECTDEDLWRKPPVWKYYKNPNSTGRSTKNFTNGFDAQTRLSDDGNVGKVVMIPGAVTACKYCSAFSICEQKDKYILDGSLVI